MSGYNLPQYSTRSTSFHSQASILDRIIAALPKELASIVKKTLDRQNYDSLGYSRPAVHGSVHGLPRNLKQIQRRVKTNWRNWFNVPNACILIWAVLLLWGERWTFESAIKACKWKNWERWPRGSTPHHLVLLADPQIVDPHTYPGRPWPLSRFTEMHTDQYMRRNYNQLEKHLHPDTIFFLGDLFDGGREWSARQGSTDDPSWAEPKRSGSEIGWAKTWKKYGDKYWFFEYERFLNIFIKNWRSNEPTTTLEQRGRRLITGLPGNHDFGFGTNVREGARERFQAYFGETNRVDVLGNHTFVSVDGLSLSARHLEIPEMKSISKPVEDFLEGVAAKKRRAVARELRYRAGESDYIRQDHIVEELSQIDFQNLPTLDPGKGAARFPTILLSHVPLYREPGAACGPMRERSPPAVPAVSPDIANGIPISGGYQYQNVLSNTDSLDILNRVEDVVHVFSGDDHDYCELTHSSTRGDVKEITIKSMSWAMGVRKPGFLLVSLWNPVDGSGQSLGTHAGGHGATSGSNIPMTIETHLCLQPNQIYILLSYATLLGLTLAGLIARAILVPILNLHPFAPVSSKASSTHDGSLPSFAVPNSDQARGNSPHRYSDSSTSSTSSNSANGASTLAPRSTFARTRSVSPGPGYGGFSYALPGASPQATLSSSSSQGAPDRNGYAFGGGEKKSDDYDAGDEEAEWGKGRKGGKPRELTKAETSWREAWVSIVWVAAWVASGYIWLVWRG